MTKIYNNIDSLLFDNIYTKKFFFEQSKNVNFFANNKMSFNTLQTNKQKEFVFIFGAIKGYNRIEAYPFNFNIKIANDKFFSRLIFFFHETMAKNFYSIIIERDKNFCLNLFGVKLYMTTHFFLRPFYYYWARNVSFLKHKQPSSLFLLFYMLTWLQKKTFVRVKNLSFRSDTSFVPKYTFGKVFLTYENIYIKDISIICQKKI